MSEVIDWSKAPEGYPIWIQGKDSHYASGWHRELSDRYQSPTGRYYMKRDFAVFTVHTCPQPAPWSGECLPPVGMCVEAYWPKDTVPAWLPFKLQYISKTHVIAEAAGKERHYQRSDFDRERPQFRPIRTHEQIAQHEKTLAVERMSLIVGDIDTVPTWTDALSTLYDAGLRFTK